MTDARGPRASSAAEALATLEAAARVLAETRSILVIDLPSRVDLLYCHRPLRELPGIIALAGRLGARALWWQTGLTSDGSKDPSGCWAPPGESRQARELAGAAGLAYVDDVYIADAVRARGTLT